MAFEPRQVDVGAWQEVKGEAIPANEASVIQRTVRLDGS